MKPFITEGKIINSVFCRLKNCLLLGIFLMISVTHASMLDRPKVGLVLSGGGAKGFAHIGILQMLDSLAIPIDYIAGTSMGGIMGALYATGFNGKELEELTKQMDWFEIFTDTPPRHLLPYLQKKDQGQYQTEFGIEGIKPTSPAGLIEGQKISLLFSSLTFPYEHLHDFDELPIPYRCVAVDLVRGEQIVLKEGSLAKAMRSTMSIPSMFSPVDWGDSLLVDGGILNNMPVDVVRQMGADIVIAVDVAGSLKQKQKLKTVIDVLEQSLNLLGIEKWRKNLELSDLYIRPDLEEYTLLDFTTNKVNDIIEEGKKAAHRNYDEFLKFKEKYQLERYVNPKMHLYQGKEMIIEDVQIMGLTSIPFDVLYKHFDIHANDMFDAVRCAECVAEVEKLDASLDAHYEVIPTADDKVRIILHVDEKSKSIIYRVDIEGNQRLSFSFIYEMLGLMPGDPLDTDLLNQRIMEMYGLGYFKSILYELTPVKQNYMALKLKVKESAYRKLRVGFYYDNHHRIVGRAGIYGTSFFTSRLRFESDFLFSGLTQFSSKVFYPTRMGSMPVYPYIREKFKDIPVAIHDVEGNAIAEYKDRSWLAGVGVGFLFGKSGNFEVEYQQEYVDVVPNIALPDPLMFPDFENELHNIYMKFTVDVLDDPILPSSGYYYQSEFESSYEQLKSDLYYYWLKMSIDYYWRINSLHNIRFFGLYAKGCKRLPTYKVFNLGHPDYFVGMDYDEITGTGTSIVRLDYRYRVNDFFYVKLIANTILNYEYEYIGGHYSSQGLWGTGLGLTFMTPLGPFEMIFATGSKGTAQKQNEGLKYYATFGLSYR